MLPWEPDSGTTRRISRRDFFQLKNNIIEIFPMQVVFSRFYLQSIKKRPILHRPQQYRLQCLNSMAKKYLLQKCMSFYIRACLKIHFPICSSHFSAYLGQIQPTAPSSFDPNVSQSGKHIRQKNLTSLVTKNSSSENPD